jgi:hypothetical protein
MSTRVWAFSPDELPREHVESGPKVVNDVTPDLKGAIIRVAAHAASR